VERFQYLVSDVQRVFRFISIFILIFTLLAPSINAAPASDADAVEVSPDDVFVIVGSTLRHPDGDTLPEAPLFNVAGVSLELTWGDWQSAGATSSAKVVGGPHTDIRIELSGLVPGGIYSVFYGTLGPDSENPLCPGVERTLAVPWKKTSQPGPDASSFVASPDGTATYRGKVDGDLLAAQQLFFTIIYHFNDLTYHPLPNAGEFLTQGENCHSSFGEDAMRQLFILQNGF
jgi:hypothetical protein